MHLCVWRLMPSTCPSGCPFPNPPGLGIMQTFASVARPVSSAGAATGPHTSWLTLWHPVNRSSSLGGTEPLLYSRIFSLRSQIQCLLFASIHLGKPQKTKPMLGLSESFSSQSLQEPRSPIWLLHDKPIVDQRDEGGRDMKKEKEGQNVAQAVMEEGERCPSPPTMFFSDYLQRSQWKQH